MAVHVTLAPGAANLISDPDVRAAAAGCRVRADGYLVELTGLSGSEWVPTHDDAYLILGTVTEDEQICLDTRTGAVLSRSTWDPDVRTHANRDLPSFARCLDAFEDSLPFYEQGAGPEVSEAAAARFTQTVRDIDDTADDPESFWVRIEQDIAAGDYNAADIELG